MPEPWERLSDKERQHTLKAIVPEARPHFQALLEQAQMWKMRPYIASALRTCEDQQGLSQSAVRGCKSWHTLGRAIDLELRNEDGGAGTADTYQLLGEFWEWMGGTWGGRWTKTYPQGLPGFPDAGPGDPVHFQWTDGAGRVPDELCPKGIDLDDCQRYADRYMAAQWANPPKGRQPPLERDAPKLPGATTPLTFPSAQEGGAPALVALVLTLLIGLGLRKASRA